MLPDVPQALPASFKDTPIFSHLPSNLISWSFHLIIVSPCEYGSSNQYSFFLLCIPLLSKMVTSVSPQVLPSIYAHDLYPCHQCSWGLAAFSACEHSPNHPRWVQGRHLHSASLPAQPSLSCSRHTGWLWHFQSTDSQWQGWCNDVMLLVAISFSVLLFLLKVTMTWLFKLFQMCLACPVCPSCQLSLPSLLTQTTTLVKLPARAITYIFADGKWAGMPPPVMSVGEAVITSLDIEDQVNGYAFYAWSRNYLFFSGMHLQQCLFCILKVLFLHLLSSVQPLGCPFWGLFSD